MRNEYNYTVAIIIIVKRTDDRSGTRGGGDVSSLNIHVRRGRTINRDRSRARRVDGTRSEDTKTTGRGPRASRFSGVNYCNNTTRTC